MEAPYKQSSRLLTTLFVHASAEHLVTNLLLFVFFIYQMETAIGGLRFGVLCIMGGLGAALTSAAFEGERGVSS
jgi:membrane associated rhomboid family serine protease